jgi:hypothetical protein
MIQKEYSICLDHLEIFFSSNDIFKPEIWFNYNINDTNTSFSYINNNDLELQYKIVTPKNYVKWFTFSFIFNWKIIDAFNVSFWDNQKDIKTQNKITFYASFILIYWKTYILDLIDNIFLTKNFNDLRRFDIACDIPETKEKLISHFKQKPTTELNFNNEKNEYETYYFWLRKKYNILIRIYDKILDTFKKNKQFLYDFKDIENLTRFEIEFWYNEIRKINNNPKLKEKITYKTLLSSEKILRDLFFSRAIKYNSFFSNNEFNEYNIVYIKPKILDLNNYFLEFHQLSQNGGKWTEYELVKS